MVPRHPQFFPLILGAPGLDFETWETSNSDPPESDPARPEKSRANYALISDRCLSLSGSFAQCHDPIHARNGELLHLAARPMDFNRIHARRLTQSEVDPQIVR